MSVRELVVLGTASQVPTRTRNHNGYLLRFDREGVLFDPGEGTQRQMIAAGVSASSITRICITHFHGDHVLGLPGVIQRLSLDGVAHPVDLHYPASGQTFVERLRGAALFDERAELRLHPTRPGDAHEGPAFTLTAGALRHPVDTLGWRIEEPERRHLLPDRLEARGVRGPAVGRLQRDGEVEGRGGRRVTLEEVSETSPGQKVAFLMDTALCDTAFELAAGVDLLVCESTFLDRDAELAEAYGHLTASQAARIAAEAGARHLVLSHFSQRYPDLTPFEEEAGALFSSVTVARDLDRVPLPPRSRPAASRSRDG